MDASCNDARLNHRFQQTSQSQHNRKKSMGIVSEFKNSVTIQKFLSLRTAYLMTYIHVLCEEIPIFLQKSTWRIRNGCSTVSKCYIRSKYGNYSSESYNLDYLNNCSLYITIGLWLDNFRYKIITKKESKSTRIFWVSPKYLLRLFLLGSSTQIIASKR